MNDDDGLEPEEIGISSRHVSDELRQLRRNVGVGAAVVCGVVALVLSAVAFVSARRQPEIIETGPVVPLSISACVPETFEIPEANEIVVVDADGEPVEDADGEPVTRIVWDEAPSDCAPVEPGELSLVELADGIAVAGQVCNLLDEPVSVVATVTWRPVNGGPNFDTVGPVPITYPPGCQAPYGTDGEVNPAFVPTDEMLAVMRTQVVNSTGPVSWRVDGVFRPVDPDRHTTVRWDSIKTFVIVDDTSLLDYPPQRFVGFENDGRVVVIEGELCANENVTTLLSLNWAAYDSTGPVEGAFVPIVVNVRQDVDAGCRTFCDSGCDEPAFRNPVPESVLILNRPDWAWRVEGTAVPVDDSGRPVGGTEFISSDEIRIP